MNISLDEKELQAVLSILATRPWAEVNQLIMKIGMQMQHQATQKQPEPQVPQGRSNSHELPDPPAAG
jgi:hypothetical protein